MSLYFTKFGFVSFDSSGLESCLRFWILLLVGFFLNWVSFFLHGLVKCFS